MTSHWHLGMKWVLMAIDQDCLMLKQQVHKRYFPMKKRRILLEKSIAQGDHVRQNEVRVKVKLHKRNGFGIFMRNFSIPQRPWLVQEWHFNHNVPDHMSVTLKLLFRNISFTWFTLRETWSTTQTICISILVENSENLREETPQCQWFFWNFHCVSATSM